MIRVPYYCPKTFINTDKNKPDDRELEEIDPIFKIKRKYIVKVRKGPPIFLEDLINQQKPVE